METPSMFFVEIWGRQNRTPIPGGIRFSWKAEYYAFKETNEDGSVRDDRHCDELIASLLGKSDIWQNAKPEPGEGFKPWFTVAIGVSGTRKTISHYTVDYQAHKGAPLEIIDQGMWIYRLVKRNVKTAIRNGQAR